MKMAAQSDRFTFYVSLGVWEHFFLENLDFSSPKEHQGKNVLICIIYYMQTIRVNIPLGGYL